MNKFFTSDWHINHGNIVIYSRYNLLSKEEKEMYDNKVKFKVSYDTVNKMNDMIVENVNKQAHKDDVIYFLGDLLFARKENYYENVKSLLERIKCKNFIMIWGNHDNRISYNLFKENYVMNTFNVDGKEVVLCHFPLAVWDKRHYGSFHLYGHCHSHNESFLDTMMPERFSLDVGIDNYYNLFGEYKMFEFKQIKEIFSKRKGFGIIDKKSL